MKKDKFRLTRRQFLHATAAAGVLIGTSGAIGFAKNAAAEGKDTSPNLKTVRTTCSPNCTGACGLNAIVEDNEIKAIVQAADYPDSEYNPRGCLKGLSMMNLVYGPDRLKTPLIQKGKAGSDELQPSTWDEALDFTAKRLKEIAEKYGPESIGVAFQVGGTGYVHKGAVSRLATLAGWNIHHAYDQNGDLPMF